MKKYLKWVILASVFLTTIIFVKKIKGIEEISEKLKGQPKVIFSAFLEKENDIGTFFYCFETDRAYKELNDVFTEIYYNNEKTKFIAKMEDDSYNEFVGIVEYDIGKKRTIPVFPLEELRELFEDPELTMNDIYAAQYIQNGYSMICKNQLYTLKKEGEQWQIKSVYKRLEQDILGPYAWDKMEESFYIRIITGDDKWKLIQHNVKTQEDIPLLENVAAFELSPDGKKIVYDELDKKLLYSYDIQTGELTLLTKHKNSLIAEKPIMFSDNGELLFFVEVSYGAIDREPMYKFRIIDLETNEMKTVKDWKRAATFYVINW